MSHISKVSTQLKDKESLIAALQDMGFTAEQIELHDTPVSLKGYGTGGSKGNIIIRKKHLANSYNDIGFVKKEDGTYEALISDPNMRNSAASRNSHTEGIKNFGNDWMNKLNQRYSYQNIKKVAALNGYAISERFVDGKLHITCDASY